MLKIKAKAIKLPIIPLMLFLLVTATYLLYPAQATSPTSYASSPSIQTDKTDYSPEQIVKVTGSGFNVSQTYAIPVMRPDGSIVKGDGSFTSGWDCITADENGGFNYSYQLDGVAGTYTVRVYPSTWTGNWDDTPIASTTFTDFALESFSLSPSSIVADSPGTYTATVTATVPGNSGSNGVKVYLAPSGTVQTGITITYASNPIQIPPYGSSGSTTMTITVDDTAEPGADTITVEAWDNPGQGGNMIGAFDFTLRVRQYYLTVNSLYDTPAGSGWYDEGSMAYASLTTGTVFDSSGAQYTFTGWSGDASGSGLTSDAILMDANKTATATWTTAQYQVTFAQSGLDADATGTVVTVFGSDAKAYGDLPNSTVVSDGISVSFSYAEIVASSVPGKQYVLTSVSGNTTSSTVTVNGVVTVTGTYKTQYLVSFAVSPSEAGTTSPSGVDLWEDAGALSISATANPGYTFSSWSSSTGSITFADANLASTTATISGAGTITANFNLNTYTITASAGPGGSINPSGAVTVNWGDSQTFTLTPDIGYYIVDVVVDGVSMGVQTSWDFTDVQADHTITASFAINTYTITVVQSAHGTIAPGTTVVNYGDDQSFTITPDADYHIVDVVVDGVSEGALTSYTFTSVTADHTITASFEINTYTITFTESGLPSETSWSVTFNGVTESSTTATITFTGITSGSYSWSASTPISGGTGTRYVAPTSSGTMEVPNQTSQTITYTTQYYLTVASAYGSASGGGWYEAGASAYATVTPLTVPGSAGTQYVFKGWSGDASGATSPSNAIVMNGPKTATANWNTQYYLTVISQYGNPHGSGWYSLNSEAKFGVTTPIDHGNKTIRVFIRWSGDADVFEPEGTIIMNKPSTVTASWETQYLVTFNTTLPNIVLSIPGVPETLPPGMEVFGGYYPAHDLVAVGPAPDTVSGTTGIRYVLEGWTLNGEMFTLGANISFAVEGPCEAAVVYNVEPLLLINAIGVRDHFTSAVTIAASTQIVRDLSPTSPIQEWMSQGAYVALNIATPNKIGHGEWAIFKKWTGQIQETNRNASLTMLAPTTVNAVFFKVNPVAESIPYSILAALIATLLCYAVERRRKTVGRKKLRLITSGITVAAAGLIIAAIVSAGIATGYGISASELLDFTNWAVVLLSLAASMFTLTTIAIIRRVQRQKLLPPLKQSSP